ncbi:Chloroperoxidase [Mycena maculata]|uniref:Chloroperoxidase n=1 Tax=Mycena maculata TaxID=230809 RepID=A0AAD7P2P5_9AGAR|nr:Chloroperoxidase [Mycena maculata]
MKSTLLLSFLSISLASAFPSFKFIPEKSIPALPTGELSPIDVSGSHAFRPPSVQDQRGPCPALNALANHGYLPRNGIARVDELLEVSRAVLGFGIDFGCVAGSLTAAYASDEGLMTSIGGPVRGSFTFCVPRLSGTHNQFESDSSPTRGDSYLYHGDNYQAQEPYFESLAAKRNASGVIDFISHRIERYDDSVSKNPYFFYGPIDMVISTLVHLFIQGIMASFPASHPGGFFTADGLQTFFGFYPDTSGQPSYRPGYERIPDDWYRRPTDYTHVDAAPHLEALGMAAPRTMIPGGNMGTVNSFEPMDLTALTGGVYTEDTLFQGKNLRCFCFQVMQLATPEQVGAAAFLAGGSIADALEEWMCPELKGLNETMYEKYPGYKKVY